MTETTSTSTRRHHPSHERATHNIVHDDENWRQRVAAEHGAATQWRDSWGFLESEKPAGEYQVAMHHSHNRLNQTLSEIGSSYPFLCETYRKQQGASPSPANQTRSSLSRTGQRILNQTTTSTSTSKPSSRPISRGIPSPNKKDEKNPALYLDHNLALSMQPRLEQGVGSSLLTQGVDPTIKYRYPVLSSQAYGWNVRDGLEFFGVNHHPRTNQYRKDAYS